MKIARILSFSLTFALCALLLVANTGCKSKKKAAKFAIPSDSASSSAAPAVPMANLPQGDSSVPDSQYVELNSGYQLGTLYYSLAGMPPDYDALAEAASKEYRVASDQFRKRDLMQALRPKIDAQLAAYQQPANRYLKVEIANELPLQHYDFGTHSFPLTVDLSSDRYLYFNDASKFSVTYTNGKDFERYPVADEQRAKEIEDLITKGKRWTGHATAYLFIQAADTTKNQVSAQIMRIVLEKDGHQELGRY